MASILCLFLANDPSTSSSFFLIFILRHGKALLAAGKGLQRQVFTVPLSWVDSIRIVTIVYFVIIVTLLTIVNFHIQALEKLKNDDCSKCDKMARLFFQYLAIHQK